MENETLWAGKTILIVDDSSLVREQLSSLYSSLGMTVVEMAEDGVKAIELFKTVAPDIVSLDIIMPEMNGIDCYRHIKALDPDFNFMFVSCLAAEAATSELLQDEIPSQQFVSKPATQESVERALAFLFGESSQPMLESSSPGARTPVAS